MPNLQKFPAEFIRKVLSEACAILSEPGDAPHGWLTKLARKHGVKHTTLGGWIKRYQTPEGVPDKLDNPGKIQRVAARRKTQPRRQSLPLPPGNGGSPSLAPPDPVTVPMRTAYDLERTEMQTKIRELKLLVADLVLELRRAAP